MCLLPDPRFNMQCKRTSLIRLSSLLSLILFFRRRITIVCSAGKLVCSADSDACMLRSCPANMMKRATFRMPFFSSLIRFSRPKKNATQLLQQNTAETSNTLNVKPSNGHVWHGLERKYLVAMYSCACPQCISRSKRRAQCGKGECAV